MRILFHHSITSSDLIPPLNIFGSYSTICWFFGFYSIIGFVLRSYSCVGYLPDLIPPLDINFGSYSTIGNWPRILFHHRPNHGSYSTFGRGSYSTTRHFRILFHLRSRILFHHRLGSYSTMGFGSYSALPFGDRKRKCRKDSNVEKIHYSIFIRARIERVPNPKGKNQRRIWGVFPRVGGVPEKFSKYQIYNPICSILGFLLYICEQIFQKKAIFPKKCLPII